MKTKKNLTVIEKAVLLTITLLVATFLLRKWDPAFLSWFHVSSMKDETFFMNVIQTVWFMLQFSLYFVWGLTMLFIVLCLAVAIPILSFGVVTLIPDIIISVWNLMSRIIPIQYIEIAVTESYFEFLEDKTYGVGEKVDDILPVLIPIALWGGILVVLLRTI